MASKSDFIPYSTQNITADDIGSVVAALESELLTQGPLVPEFEREVSLKVGAKHACAFNSATSALHCACIALGLGSGDIVWVPAISFVASANCAIYCGAQVDFLDINKDSFNLCVDFLEQKLERAKKESNLPKVVVVVHMAGAPADLKKIFELSVVYGFHILEDASHALGAKYYNENIGSCKYSDVTVFSFHPVKTITSGEGGMATTNKPEIFEKLVLLRSHGITRDPIKMKFEPQGSWYYEQICLGYNYRMNELEAALGLSQLKRLESMNEKRNKLALFYYQTLKDEPIKLPNSNANNYSSWHLYIIKIEKHAKYPRDYIFEALRKSSIGVNLHYIPIYHHPFYRNLLPNRYYLKNAEEFYQNAMSIPLHPKLKHEEQLFIVDTLKAFLT